MLLTNLFQLINDLDKNFSLFFKPIKNNKTYPIQKITLESKKCVLICGKDSAKTINDLITLLGKIKQKNIPLEIQLSKQFYKIYGLQIDRTNKRLYLK